MTTGYVVSAVGYEYNDEIYSQSDNGAGTPIKVYLDQAKAKQEADRLNFQELMTCSLDQYAYDLDDIINDMELFERTIHKYNSSIDVSDSDELGDWFANHASGFSKEDQAILLDVISLEFYQVTEVEFDASGDNSVKDNHNDRFKL